MRRSSLAALATCASMSFAPSLASAGGFEVGENGTRALGRAGAYVATVDEPSAIYFNPAALARIEHTAATLNLNLVNYELTFQRAPYVWAEEFGQDREREINFEEVEQENPIFAAPMGFASTNFGLEGWGFGLGAYGPTAFGVSRFPEMTVRPDDFTGEPCGVYKPCAPRASTPGDETAITRDGGQGYMMTERSVLLVYPSLSAARLFERAGLSVGLTLQAAILSVKFTTGVDGQYFDVVDADAESLESDDFYTPNSIEVLGATMTGILGLLWTHDSGLSIGASYRPQFKVRARGTVDIEFPPGLLSTNPRLSDDTTTLRLHFPDVVRGGVAYTKRGPGGAEKWDIEANVVWENWSVLDYFDVQLDGTVTDDSSLLDERPIPRLRLGRYFEDALSFRVGSDLSFLRDETTGQGPVFRVGASYETSSSPVEWTNVDFTPFQRIGATGGFSYHLGQVFGDRGHGLSLDVAYAAFFSPDRDVENGKFDVMVPLWICNAPEDWERYPAEECSAEGLNPSHPTNNGHYETFTQTFSLGATYGW